MKFKVRKKGDFQPIKVEITLLTAEEALEFQARMALYNTQLKRINVELVNLLSETSVLQGITRLRGDLIKALGEDSLYDAV